MQSDVTISDLRLQLTPASGRVPFEPLVEALSVDLSAAAFGKIVAEGVRKVGDRVPVEIELGSVRLINGGAEIVMKVKRSILRAELKIRLAFSVANPETIRMQIADIDAPAWVPTQFVIEHGMNFIAGRPGFSRAADLDNAVDINPAVVIASRALPVKLATPGAWAIDTNPDRIRTSYAS